MINFFKTDKGFITFLIIIFLCLLTFFIFHQGLLLIDTGREFYIPSQMLKGEVLYKDIFNIYGPFSYQFNALLFFIFKEHFNTLYFAGIINSLIMIIALFLLSREFLSKSISFLISLIIMFSLVFNTFLYNSNLPYTFAISYALCAFLISLLFLIKYIKNENYNYAYLSSLFAGLSLANKYEFCIYPLILIYVFSFIKPLGLKNFFKAIFCFLFFPALCLFSLIFQGLNLEDIKYSAFLINKLVYAPSLKIFFSKFGVFFNLKTIINLSLNGGFYSVFGFLPAIIIILFISKIKKIYQNKPVFILTLTAISACAKFLFFLNISHMGAFIFPVCLLCALVLINLFERMQKFIPIFLIIFALFFAGADFKSLNFKNYKIETKKAALYTYKKEGKIINTACDFIINNTSDEDKIAVLPEGYFINFITNKNGSNYYYNLSPLFYDDVFGENKILSDFEKSMPDYFIILPINNIEYGKSFFGIDYAQNFYEMIKKNYKLIQNINNVQIYGKNK